VVTVVLVGFLTLLLFLRLLLFGLLVLLRLLRLVLVFLVTLRQVGQILKTPSLNRGF